MRLTRLSNVCVVLDYAARLGCMFVNFDGDGHELEGLLRFDW